MLKNGHLLRFLHPSSLRRTPKYASLLRISGALHLALFEQPGKDDFISNMFVFLPLIHLEDYNFKEDLLKYPPMKILLVEDDKGIARFVKKGFLENAFSVDLAFDGEEGLFLALHRSYDLVVLDIMLPKMDGREVLRRLRGSQIQTPVIFLTAKDSESDIVQGLDAGADDYLVKPFSFNELLARIRALLRRGKMVSSSSKLQLANLFLELDGHQVYRDNVKIELTPKEYTLLEYFMRHPGQVVTRTMISEKIWDYHFDTETNIVDVHVSHLRNKIDKNFEPKLLHTLKGVGYVLEDRS